MMLNFVFFKRNSYYTYAYLFLVFITDKALNQLSSTFFHENVGRKALKDAANI